MEGTRRDIIGAHRFAPNQPAFQKEGTSNRVASCLTAVATVVQKKTIQPNLYGSHVAAVIPAFAAQDHRFWSGTAREKVHSHLVWDFKEQQSISQWFQVKPSPLALLPQGIGGHFIGL